MQGKDIAWSQILGIHVIYLMMMISILTSMGKNQQVILLVIPSSFAKKKL